MFHFFFWELSASDSHCKGSKHENLLLLGEAVHEDVSTSNWEAIFLPSAPSARFVVLCSSCNCLFAGKRCRSKISQELISLGRGDISKCFGICCGKWRQRIEVSLLSSRCQSQERASATLFSFPANHWLYPFIFASINNLAWWRAASAQLRPESALCWICRSLIFASIPWLWCCLSWTMRSLRFLVGRWADQSRGWWLLWGIQVNCLLLEIGDLLGSGNAKHVPDCCIPPILLGTNLNDRLCRGHKRQVDSCQSLSVLLLKFLSSTLNPSCTFCWLWWSDDFWSGNEGSKGGSENDGPREWCIPLVPFVWWLFPNLLRWCTLTWPFSELPPSKRWICGPGERR